MFFATPLLYRISTTLRDWIYVQIISEQGKFGINNFDKRSLIKSLNKRGPKLETCST
jgi:hypothetical protein